MTIDKMFIEKVSLEKMSDIVRWKEPPDNTDSYLISTTEV